MPEQGIIDIFEPDDTRRPSFEADNTVADLPLTAPAQIPSWLDTDDSQTTGRRFFGPQDSFTILSLGVRIPYCFSLADSFISLKLLLSNAALTFTTPITEISNTGRVFIPIADTEIPLNIFVRFPNRTPNEKMQLTYEITMRVSQIGAPDILNGVDIFVYPFVKVRHTSPLIV